MHVAKRAAIIGAGISGLASSIRLSKAGYAVDVYEKNDHPGGKLSELRMGEYRFDMGPSLFTLPQLIEDLFTLCNVPLEEYLTYERLEIICRYFYGDGTVINAFRDPEQFAREVERKTGEPAVHVERFLRHSSDLYQITHKVFIFNAFHQLRNLMNRDSLKTLIAGWKMEPFTTMHRSNSRRFRDSRIIQLFDRYATYNGSNPYVAPATLNVIAHLEHNLGAFFPEKGMYQIIRSLVSLSEKMGVRFFMNSPVTSVVLNGKKVTGIVCNEIEKAYDIIISGIDVYTLYKHLLPEDLAPPRLWKTERSSSALIFYWGMHKKFPELDLHNILFSNDYRNEFDHMYTKNDICDDPTVYIFISSKVVKEDAPFDAENWFVMINTPVNTGQDWDELVRNARKNIIGKINRIVNDDIDKFIEYEHVLDPTSLERYSGSAHGAIYGTSSNSPFAAFLRHPNRRKKIRGLYFTGGSVHPGGGIPLCLASAAIVAGTIFKDEK